MLIAELFTRPRDMEIKYTTDSITSTVSVNGREVNFEAEKTDYDANSWSIYFDEDGSLDATGSGGEFDVFGYAKHFLDKVIQQTRAAIIKVEVDDGLKSREKLYQRLLKRYSAGSKYTLSKETNKYGTITYTLALPK